MNPVMFSVGKVEVRWYSFFILVAVIIGFILAIREGKKKKIDKDIIFDMGFYIVIFGILGARLYYVLFNFKEYQYNVLEIFRLWNGGLAIHGGILFGLLTIYIFSKIKNIKLSTLTDIVAPSLILGQAIGRWGNFFNSEAHGPITALANLQKMKIIPNFVIKGMKIDGVYYHPTFYYEFLWCLVGFIMLILIRNLYKKLKSGQLTCIYLMWYSFGRFFIESLRTDSLMILNLKVAQILSVILFVVSLVFFLVIMFRTEKVIEKEIVKEDIKEELVGKKVVKTSKKKSTKKTSSTKSKSTTKSKKSTKKKSSNKKTKSKS